MGKTGSGAFRGSRIRAFYEPFGSVVTWTLGGRDEKRRRLEVV
jgi:hypothetical protein